MSKIIFLDIDGVLVTDIEIGEDYVETPGTGPFSHPFSARCVENLNDITSRTGAEICISSTWRLRRSVGELKELLKVRGVTAAVVGKTPVINEGCRGDEIKSWLAHHPAVTSFCILDDDADMGDLIDHLVLTSTFRGIGIRNVEIATQMLGQQTDSVYAHTCPHCGTEETTWSVSYTARINAVAQFDKSGVVLTLEDGEEEEALDLIASCLHCNQEVTGEDGWPGGQG